MPKDTVARAAQQTFAPSRAAQELGLKRAEFDLAVRLGRIRTGPAGTHGERRVGHTEIERLRAVEGFPDALRESVRTVGTTECASLMDIPPGRFTRFARLGLVVPVTFYVNRYRAVVWRYLAEEMRQFAADGKHAALLTGRLPETLRDRLGEGTDLRARNWRGRYLGLLLRQADGPWQHAAILAAFLDPADVADIVTDAGERARLDRLRPELPAHGSPGSPTARIAEDIMTATEEDEAEWLRCDLARSLEEARGAEPVSRPAVRHAVRTRPPLRAGHPATAPAARHRPVVPAVREPVRGLLARLRRRSGRPARL